MNPLSLRKQQQQQYFWLATTTARCLQIHALTCIVDIQRQRSLQPYHTPPLQTVCYDAETYIYDKQFTPESGGTWPAGH